MTHKPLRYISAWLVCIGGIAAWQLAQSKLETVSLAVQPVSNPGDDGKKPAESSTTKPGTAASDDGEKEKATPLNKRKKNVEEEVTYNKLTPFEANVILRRGTERAFTGEYTDLKDPGTYICRRCNAPLYYSDSKFESHCGWPSFDDEIKGAVKRRPEIDGTRRIEIVCNNCGGHLGHVFMGEGYTAKNTRHCVNSVSMKFVAKGQPLPEVIKAKGKEKAKDADKEKAAAGKLEDGKADPIKPEAGKSEPAKTPGT